MYTWNPMTAGTLFKKAGYKDIKVTVIRHKWPKNYRKIYKIFGLRFFNLICSIYAVLKNNYQIKIEAKK